MELVQDMVLVLIWEIPTNPMGIGLHNGEMAAWNPMRQLGEALLSLRKS